MTDSDEPDISPKLAQMLFDHHMKYRKWFEATSALPKAICSAILQLDID